MCNTDNESFGLFLQKINDLKGKLTETSELMKAGNYEGAAVVICEMFECTLLSNENCNEILYMARMFFDLENYSGGCEFAEEFLNGFIEFIGNAGALAKRCIDSEKPECAEYIRSVAENCADRGKKEKEVGLDSRVEINSYLAEGYSACKMHGIAIELYKRAFNAEHEKEKPSTDVMLEMIMRLGYEYGEQDENEEAIKMYTRAYKEYRRLYGDEDYRTSFAAFCLGREYSICGDSENAIKIFKRVLKACIYNKESKFTELVMHTCGELAKEYENCEDEKKAVDTLELMMQRYAKDIGAMDDSALAVMCEMCEKYYLIGEAARANMYARNLYDIIVTRFGENDERAVKLKQLMCSNPIVKND